MRWFALVLALIVLASCDDSTGPGGGDPAEWVVVPLPAEVGEGVVAAVASGGGRSVGLVRGSTGEWVVEQRGPNWEVLLDERLPIPDTSVFARRAIPFGAGASDVVVDGRGRVYAVGSVVHWDGLFGVPVPAIWAESDTGWVRIEQPEFAGALARAVAPATEGIVAAGTLADGAQLLFMEGVPGPGASWSSAALPEQGAPAAVTAMALDGGTTYLGGFLAEPGFEFRVRAFFYAVRAGQPSRLDPPCGECPDLLVESAGPGPGGIWWAGSIRGERAAEDPVGNPARGWLSSYDPGHDAWDPVPLPAEITGVHDLQATRMGGLYMAVASDVSGIYRSFGRSFAPETSPPGAQISALTGTPDREVIAAGSIAAGSRGEPVLFERVP